MKTKAILTMGVALAFVACQQPRQQEVTETEVLDIPVCEGTTDIPEHHYLINDRALNWDLRARGLSGDLNLPLTS